MTNTDAGIVDEDVDAPEACECGIDHACHVRRITQVEQAEFGTRKSVLRTAFGGDQRQFPARAVGGQIDRGARIGQRARRGTANAARSAGDKCDLAGQCGHLVS